MRSKTSYFNPALFKKNLSFRIFSIWHNDDKKADGFSEKMKIKEEFHPEMWYNLITTKNHAKQIRRNSSWLIIQQIQAL